VNIEGAIKDVITTKLEEGHIEKMVAENLEKGVNKALESLLGNYGDITKVIQGKIKEVMIKQLSSYDYSNYVVKLDCVLSEILQKTALDHKKILQNFKELMIDAKLPVRVKVSDIFEQFKKYVSENVDTSELEVDTDDTPTYEHVPVTMEVEYEEKRSWGCFRYARVIFECGKDENLNCEIHLSKFKEYPWSMSVGIDTSINSLRYLDEFKIYLLKLSQIGDKIEIDDDYLEDDVRPEAEPEVSFG
jgi:hypothetical protein